MTFHPQTQIVLGYSDVFNDEPPNNPLELLKGICRRHLLFELVALNYRLRRKFKLYPQTGIEAQTRGFRHFVKGTALRDVILESLNRVYRSFGETPILFNKAACLIAIDKILSSGEIQIIKDFKFSTSDWDNIVTFLLCVNDEVTEADFSGSEEATLEQINSKLLLLQELHFETNPLFIPYRGLKLWEFLSENGNLGIELSKFIYSKYQLTFREFVYRILEVIIVKKSSNPDFEFRIVSNTHNEPLLKGLSKRNYGMNPLISLKKSPLIEDAEGVYLISDYAFLIDHTYSQLLNDFWFDWVKGRRISDNKVLPIAGYKGHIGRFFEHYVVSLVRKISFSDKYSMFLSQEELRIPRTGGEIEVADFYLRSRNRVWVGEIKAGLIPDRQRYGGTLERFYNSNRDEFYNRYGINQLVEHLKAIFENYSTFDPHLPMGKALHIFPSIVFNDPICHAPLMAHAFNTRFNELLHELDFPNKVRIYPLSLVFVGDLEKLLAPISENKNAIWESLKRASKGALRIPFVFHLPRKKGVGFPIEVMEEFKEMVEEFGAKN